MYGICMRRAGRGTGTWARRQHWRDQLKSVLWLLCFALLDAMLVGTGGAGLKQMMVPLCVRRVRQLSRENKAPEHRDARGRAASAGGRRRSTQ
jgi:hypothetical protein